MIDALRMTAVLAFTACAFASHAQELRGTGDLGLVIERTSGSVVIVDTSARTALATRYSPEVGTVHTMSNGSMDGSMSPGRGSRTSYVSFARRMETPAPG